MIQGAMGYRAPGKALARCQWRGPKKLLYFSCFGLPKIHLHTAQILVVNMQITVWKSLIGSQEKPITDSDGYIPLSLYCNKK